MSSFLAGIAMRGAGLYPVARPRAPQPGVADVGSMEMASETTVGAPVVGVAFERREQWAEPGVTPGTDAPVEVRAETIPSAMEPPSSSITYIQNTHSAAASPSPIAHIEHVLRGDESSHTNGGEQEHLDVAPEKIFATHEIHVLTQAAPHIYPDQLLTREVPVRPISTELPPVPLPQSRTSIAPPDVDPRPVEVRIGSIEVRAAASPVKPAPTSTAKPATAAGGFDSFARVRNYRRGV